MMGVGEISFNNNFGVSIYDTFCTVFEFIEVICSSLIYYMMGANVDQIDMVSIRM